MKNKWKGIGVFVLVFLFLALIKQVYADGAVVVGCIHLNWVSHPKPGGINPNDPSCTKQPVKYDCLDEFGNILQSGVVTSDGSGNIYPTCPEGTVSIALDGGLRIVSFDKTCGTATISNVCMDEDGNTIITGEMGIGTINGKPLK